MVRNNRVHRRLSIEELEPRIAPAAGWQEIPTSASADNGGISANLGNSITPAMVLGADGNPIVAWSDASGGNPEIYVRRWNGAQWAMIGAGSATGGGISSTATNSFTPVIAVGADGNPIVAWSELAAGHYAIYVRRWDGASWSEMGASSGSGTGISSNAEENQFPAIAVGTDGIPVIAWQDTVGATARIYVRRWDGSNWSEISPGSATGSGVGVGHAQSPGIAIGSDGNPIVAWTWDSGGPGEIYVRRWDGANWSSLGVGSDSGGGISNNPTASTAPVIALGADGLPIIAWQDFAGTNQEIFVRRYDGSSWVEIGTGSATGNGISKDPGSSYNTTIAIGTDGKPIIAWQTDFSSGAIAPKAIYLRRWTGASWVEMGFQSASSYGIQGGGSSGDPVVRVNNGKIVLAYTFLHPLPDVTNDIYVRRWDGLAWADYGTTGSATGGGISMNAGDSNAPAAAYQPSGTEGNVIIAWADDSSGQPQIYVKYWSAAGQNWAPMGATSTTGPGISNTGHATSPSISASGSDGNPVVAWQDVNPLNGNSEIYVRKWNGSSWVELGGSASGGGISNNATASTFPSVAFGTDGNPVVVWENTDSGAEGDEEIYVKRWSGTSWVEMVAGSATGGGISANAYPSLRPVVAGFFSASSIGTPVVAWADLAPTQYEIHLRYWTGTAWSPTVSNISSSGYIDINPAIAKHPTTGNWTIAWQESNSYTQPTNWDIYARQWNGSAYDPIMSVGTNVGLSCNPSVVVGTDGIPIVAWDDNSSGYTQIYLRRYVGASWTEMPNSYSAVGGGVSNTPGLSINPRLVTGSHGVRYLVWQDSSNGNNEIYLQKWDGTPMAGSIVNTPLNPVMRPNIFSLTANNMQDIDGTVMQVQFWRDVNGDGLLSTGDSNFSTDADGSNGWYGSWYASNLAFALGPNTFFARGVDNDGNYTNVVSCVATLVDAPPSVGALTSFPNPVNRGATLTLTASGAMDPDGFVAGLDFYWDSNYNGVFDAGVDQLLPGTAVTSGSAWIWSGPTPAGIRSGANTFFARPRDNDGMYGNPAEPFSDSNGNSTWDTGEPFTDLYRDGKWGSAGTPTSTIVTVWDVAPTAGSVTYSPGPIQHSLPVTLTANGVTDPDGSVARVEFWRDANGSLTLERGTDRLLGLGSPWLEVGASSASDGGISGTAGPSANAAMALGTDGNPVIAWDDSSSGNNEIYALRWDGTSWVAFGTAGSISGNTGSSTNAAVIGGADNNPIVAWSDNTNGNWEIYVRRWDGASWLEMGGGSATDGGISNNSGDSRNPAMILGPGGLPIVAWDDSSGGNTEIFVRRWDGASWVEMGTGSASGGGISTDAGASLDPGMALGAGGLPTVAWQDNSRGNFEIYVRRWDGTSWAEVGAAGSASSGGISGNAGASLNAAVAAGMDGNPMVAWSDNSGGSPQIYVRRWDGASWAEYVWGLQSSATGGGISNDSGASQWPSIAIGTGGNPIVAWNDDSSGNAEIYVRQWAGSSWAEVGTGSASTGGVSRNTGASTNAAMVVGTDGTPIVAWQDLSGGNSEIYVRRYSPNQWAWCGPASSLPVGVNTFFAIAMDPDGAWSNIVSVNGTVQDAPPQIGAVADSPDPVKRTEMLTLTASGVTDSDGTITRVEFYRDVNTNGTIEIGTDVLLGADTNSAGGWTWTGAASGLPTGTNQYLARAVDDAGLPSNVVSTTGVVLDTYAPTIASLTDTPDPVLRPNDLTLTATGVTDGDGTVTQVQFYRDANNNGILDALADTLLGTSPGGAGGWTWTGPTTSFPAGVNRFFARAQDNDLQWGNVVPTTTLVQNAVPTVSSLSDTPDFVVRPDMLTLTADGATDPDGSVTAVEFYRDRNGNGVLDVGVDALLGTDTSDKDGWAWYCPTTSLPDGRNTFFARAVDRDGARSNVVATPNTLVTPVVVFSGFTRTFMDADGDGIGVAMSGGGTATVVFTASNFFSIWVAGTTSRSTMTVTDDRVGPGTISLGAVTVAPGLNTGTIAIRSGSPNAVLSGTQIAVDANISTLSIGTRTNGLDVTIGGSVGNAVFSGNVANSSLTTGGNLGTLTANGAWDNSALVISGDARTVKIVGTSGASTLGFSGLVTTLVLGRLNNTQVTLTGDAGTVTLSGGMRNGARLDAVDINALSVSNGIDGSNISIVGDLHDLKAYGGMTNASNVTVSGEVRTATVSGATGAPSIQTGSVLEVGSLKTALTMTGALAGTVRVDGSAARSLIKITGDLSGGLFANLFGNVTITGRFTGAIGDAFTLPGTGNTLRITQPGGGGVLTPLGAFATKIGYP